jgi:hypothetical protein
MNGKERHPSGTSKPDQWYDQNTQPVKTSFFPSIHLLSKKCDIHRPFPAKNKIRVTPPGRAVPSRQHRQQLQFTHPSARHRPLLASLPYCCPKPSFVRGPKSSMHKVEDLSIWLCWAVDPASALRVLLLPPLLALPMHFLLPLLLPYLSPSLQGVGSPSSSSPILPPLRSASRQQSYAPSSCW